MIMKSANPKLLTGRHALMLAVTISTLAMVDRAEAKCDPESPVNDKIVTCTGTTDGQNGNGTIGYGTNTDIGNTINVLSGASVTGTLEGVLLHDGTINNDGLIEATGSNAGAIVAIATVTVNNKSSGTIRANGANTAAIVANQDANVTSSGRIEASGADGIGSTITNSGAIISTAGASGTAIQLSGAADTLTLLTGSRIIGAIEMGGGSDVVNFSSGKDVAQLVRLNNFTGTINTSGSAPVVHSATQIASLDPTALAQTDRTLLDFTAGVSSLVQGRLNGVSPSANGAMMAMSYAPENSKAGPFTK